MKGMQGTKVILKGTKGILKGTATCKKIRTFWIWEIKYIGFIMLQTRIEYQY